ncbi:helix-turn-helix domain-containing protein [Cerasibacillus sp. JNUCC 74]
MIYYDCNMNIAHAAKQLFIHRNTLIYRLHKKKY